MAELRTKIPKDISMKLRVIFVKKGKGSISKITTKALREFFENHKEGFKDYIKLR